MLSGRDIVCMYCEPWETALRTSKHRLMEYFAQHNRVLYVEHPVHPLVALKRPREFVSDLGRWWQGTRKVAENIYVLKGSYPLPYHPITPLTASLWANTINQRWFGRRLAATLAQLGFHQPIFWLYYPIVAPVLPRFKPGLAVVHVVDDWTAFAGTPATYRQVEEQALRQADLVITSSQPLYDMNKALNTNTYLVRHGADVELFARASDPATPVPDDLRALPGPLIGYYGALHKLDGELIRYLAQSRPGWSFVFIGPVRGAQGADLSWARGLPNVHFLGSRPHNALPGYLKGFNAVLFPFKVDKISYSMCPLKVYECLPAGAPVVSQWIPEIDVLGELVYAARTRKEFLAKLEEALNELPARRQQRMDFAKTCTWEAMVSRIEQLLEGSVGRRSLAASVPSS